VEKNALAEATAMAKMKDDHFELVINIQRFTPEEVKVYLDGHAVIVTAKHETTDGFVTGKTNLPGRKANLRQM
jgi:HSP20 family molecular chaperone IbpA